MSLKMNTFLMLFLVSFTIFPQSNNLKSVFVSAHSGIFFTSIENFDKTYDSNIGLVYGLGIGLPLSTRSYIYGKATLFSKSGAISVPNYAVVNGELVYVFDTREGSANFTQFIINGGFLYNLFLNKDWTLGLNGGLTYSIVSDEQKNGTGTIVLSVEGSGIFGFFVGAVLEKNFDQSPISIFFEPQFNFMRSDVLNYTKNYGGINLNLGARYYFDERRLE